MPSLSSSQLSRGGSLHTNLAKVPEKQPVASRKGGVRTRSEQQRAFDTRVALITAARDLFSEIGYHATGINEIVARAGVTRGALYHHFANKDELFETVYRETALKLSDEAQAMTQDLAGHTWDRVIATVAIYLDLVAHRRDYQRILLIDGPVVFGWQHWRELRAEYALTGWVDTLAMLADQVVVAEAPHGPMAQLIVAAMDDAALTIAHATDRETVLAEMNAALARLLGGLRIKP